MRLNPNKAVQRLLKKATVNKADGLWSMVKADYDDGLEARRPFEQEWAVNMAFLVGKQYSYFNQSTHMLNELGRVKGRIRSVDNIILSKWRRQVADMVKNDPVVSVVPNTNDIEDVKAAKNAAKIITAFQRDNGLRKKKRQLACWIYSCGNGFLDDRWNKRLGPSKMNLDTGVLEFLGDADVGVWSPFEVVVPPNGLGDVDLHSFPWIIKVKYRTLDWIVSNFPKRGKEVVAETSSNTNNVGLFMKAGTEIDRIPGAFVINYYKQPCADFPKGVFITAANKIILEKNDYPLTHYHLEQFKDIDVPGQFWGKATMGQAIGLQRTWNSTRSSIEEYNRTMGKGKMLKPIGSNMKRDPDDTHGEVISYKPVLGHKPESMDLKGMPQTYPLILEITKGSIDDLFSQHEVSRGTNRSDIRSGDMVEVLREQDAHGNIPTHLVFEESYEVVMARVLKRIQKGYTTERMIRVVGREGEFDIFSFKGADLRNNTDVSVKRQSSQPESRVALEGMILKKFELGLYGNPQDPEVRRHVMNMLDDAVVEDIYSDTRLDESYARFENELLKQGQKIQINSYDDHALHTKEHNHERKQMEYQKLKVRKETLKQFLQAEAAFTLHLLAHNKFIEQARQRAMQMAMAMGTGGSKPQGGPKGGQTAQRR